MFKAAKDHLKSLICVISTIMVCVTACSTTPAAPPDTSDTDLPPIYEQQDDPQATPQPPADTPDSGSADDTPGNSADSSAETTDESTETKEPDAAESPAPPEDEPLPEASTFEIHYLDVGQADAALVLCDGKAMLIDGGNSADSSFIYAYLKQRNIETLEYIIATHGHEDHVGGLSGALNYASVGTAYCSVDSYDSAAFRDFVKYLEAQDKQITIPQAGETFSLGSASVQIVGVNSSAADHNNTSIVLRIVYGSTSFLFAGDAERDAEQIILDAGYDLASTVLKVGHHGSESSTGYVFLREIAPQYAVISVGAGNSYGHPTEDTLSRLRDADVEVFRTDLQGTIVCVSDGKEVTFSLEKNANADPFTPGILPEDQLADILRTACSKYHAKSDRTLTGTLTYKIVSSTEVKLEYHIDTLISADTLYKVDVVSDELLNFIISEIKNSDYIADVSVSAMAYYDMAEDSSAPEDPEQTPTGTDYIGNKNSKVFHYSWCDSAKRMKESNKYYHTGTRDEMIDKGYRPCKNCNP